MKREELPNEASREDKMREALAHYEELATKACWHRSDIPEAIRAYYAPLPPAEGAEEITAKEYLQNKYPQMRGHLWNSNEYINDDWIAEMMEGFATLHAQRIADKMVSERLREELIAYKTYENIFDNKFTTVEDLIDEYLKTRVSHD